MGKNIEIKTFSDFEAMVNAGNTTYTGLVEGIGYVYWKTQTLYFIRTNPKELWATPKYQQIPFPYFQRKDVEIVNKTLHTLYVLSREELMKLDFDVYYAFYGVVDEMMKLIHQRDAISQYKAMPLPKIPFSKSKNGVTYTVKQILSLGSQINDQIGAPMGMMDMLIENKRIGRIGDGLSLISIANDIEKGEYWSLTGDVLMFVAGKTRLSPYSTIFDAAKWMYNTNLMQTRLARSYAVEYKNLESKWRNEKNVNKAEELRKAMEIQKNAFKECVDNLGISY